MTVKELNKKHNWNIPELCPECGAETQVSSSGDVFCPNENCNKKTEHCFNKFFDVLDIKGGGSVFIDKIVKKDNNRYPFCCDFYIPSLDLFIECQFGMYHNKRPYIGDFNDLNEIELLKEKSKNRKKISGKDKSRYDSVIYTWSIFKKYMFTFVLISIFIVHFFYPCLTVL